MSTRSRNWLAFTGGWLGAFPQIKNHFLPLFSTSWLVMLVLEQGGHREAVLDSSWKAFYCAACCGTWKHHSTNILNRDHWYPYSVLYYGAWRSTASIRDSRTVSPRPWISWYRVGTLAFMRRFLDADLSTQSSFVAVHGLNGDAMKTWTSGNICWLNHPDLLPKYLKRARVLTWGYNANISSLTGKSTSSERILQHAQTLVAQLHADRNVSWFCSLNRIESPSISWQNTAYLKMYR